MIHIMMCTYQGEKYLKQQLQSILSQTVNNWKLFIQDDGSTDDTVRIIEQYASAYPGKIIYLGQNEKHGENKGAKDNFASIFDKTPRAEYYMFCDQDDIWEKNKLEWMISNIPDSDNTSSFLMFCDMKVVRQDGSMVAPSFMEYSGVGMPKCKKELVFRRLLSYNFVTGAAMMFNDVLRQRVGKIPKEAMMHDWYLALCVTGFGGELIFIPRALQAYRQHDINVLGAFSTTQVSDKARQLFHIRKVKELFGTVHRYIENNQAMKQERTRQYRAFYRQYKGRLPKSSLKSIREYDMILNERNGFIRVFRGIKGGYRMWSLGYSVKYLLF